MIDGFYLAAGGTNKCTSAPRRVSPAPCTRQLWVVRGRTRRKWVLETERWSEGEQGAGEEINNTQKDTN